VADLGRNVIVETADPAGVRGHLLAHDGPVQAIVTALGFDERTIARAGAGGQHGQRLHEYLVQPGQVDLQHARTTLVGKRGCKLG
jgi:hypothetical protein